MNLFFKLGILSNEDVSQESAIITSLLKRKPDQLVIAVSVLVYTGLNSATHCTHTLTPPFNPA